MRIAILSRNPRLYSTSRLVEAGQARGIRLTLSIPCTATWISPVRDRQFAIASDFYNDAVIPQLAHRLAFTAHRSFANLKWWAHTANESVAISRSRDKLRSLQLYHVKA